MSLALASARLAVARARGRLAGLHLHVDAERSLVGGAMLARIARRLGVPVLVHLHAGDLRGAYARLSPRHQQVVRRALRHADGCLVAGPVARSTAVDLLHLRPERVRALAAGVPPLALSRHDRVDGRPFHLVYAGPIDAGHGVRVLLEALASPALADRSWRATLAGDGEVDASRDVVRRLRLGERIELTGPLKREAVHALLADADALVVPSFDAALPAVLLEALSAGVPVICTPVGELGEVLADGETALFVAQGHAGALASAIAALQDDPALAQRLSTAGLGLYARRFSLTAHATRMLQLYRRFGFLDT